MVRCVHSAQLKLWRVMSRLRRDGTKLTHSLVVNHAVQVALLWRARKRRVGSARQLGRERRQQAQRLHVQIQADGVV